MFKRKEWKWKLSKYIWRPVSLFLALPRSWFLRALVCHISKFHFLFTGRLKTHEDMRNENGSWRATMNITFLLSHAPAGTMTPFPFCDDKITSPLRCSQPTNQPVSHSPNQPTTNRAKSDPHPCHLQLSSTHFPLHPTYITIHSTPNNWSYTLLHPPPPIQPPQFWWRRLPSNIFQWWRS